MQLKKTGYSHVMASAGTGEILKRRDISSCSYRDSRILKCTSSQDV